MRGYDVGAGRPVDTAFFPGVTRFVIKRCARHHEGTARLAARGKSEVLEVF